jgi:CheY-like chemotaxis protein
VVIEAVNGQNVLDLIEILIPDLLITDIRMQGMSGFELLKLIKKNEKYKHIPVIAYSASVMKEEKEKILNMEFSGLLIKPVQVTTLYAELMNHLDFHILENEPEEQTLTNDDIKANLIDPQALIAELDGSFYLRWKMFEHRQPIGKIREFSVNLISLGEKHQCPSIIDYAGELLASAENFNIESMLKLVNEYPQIVKNIKYIIL